MVRNFNLINEKGQSYSLMDIKNYCLLTDPEGLGCSFSTEFSQINYSFIENSRHIDQSQIGGTLNFINYDNYASFMNFIANATSLKFQYQIPKKDRTATYYKDVKFKSLSKSEVKPNGVISEGVIFEATSLWYEENAITYIRTDTDTNEVRWDFSWDAQFLDYNTQNIIYMNDAHTESPFVLEIKGFTMNPQIIIAINDNVINSIKINHTIQEGETLYYSTKDTNLSIYIIDEDGEKENLFNSLDLNNTNFFKIPQGASNIKIISEESEISDAKLTIFKEYIAV